MERSACPIACTLDIIGDNWSLVILRDALYKGYTTYGQFASSEEGISTNILAARLKKLVEGGIFVKEQDKKNKLVIHYQLTRKGRELHDVVAAVGKWGIKHMEGTLDMRDKMKLIKDED